MSAKSLMSASKFLIPIKEPSGIFNAKSLSNPSLFLFASNPSSGEVLKVLTSVTFMLLSEFMVTDLLITTYENSGMYCNEVFSMG